MRQSLLPRRAQSKEKHSHCTPYIHHQYQKVGSTDAQLKAKGGTKLPINIVFLSAEQGETSLGADHSHGSISVLLKDWTPPHELEQKSCIVRLLDIWRYLQASFFLLQVASIASTLLTLSSK